MRGVPTPDDVEIEFRKHYLATGNIRSSARQVGIPETTGHDLATRANADLVFVQARADMYARALPDAERMLRKGMEIALDRIETEPESLKDLVDLGAAKVSTQDPRPAYFRGLVDAYKVLTGNRKLDAKDDGEAKPVEVHVHLKSDPDPEPDGNGS